MYGVVLVLAFWIGLAPPEALAAHGDTHTPVGTVITFDSATVKFTWLLTSTNTLFKDSRVLNTPGVDYDTVQLLSAVDVTANIETAYIGPNETAVFVKHVRNLGNGADTFRLRADSAANLVTGVFLDADGDSVYDASDPPRDSIVLLSISDTNALYETVVLVVAQAPPTAFDGQVDTVQFSATSTDILPHAETVSLVLTVDSQPPTVPAQQSPASDHDTTQTVLTFTWSASTDTRSGLARYRFQMDTAGSFTAPAVDSTTGETTYTVPAALTANLYYWRVRAIDTVGNVTNNTDSFHVRVDTGEKITLVSPSSDHETSATTVRFAWSTEDNAETYTWQFSKSAAFAAISDSAVDTSATTIVKNLTDQDTYYWRVIGRDRVGNYDTTAGRFILLDTTVFAVSLAAPADGHETTAAVFLVAWSAVGDSVGIDSYALELAKNTGFTNMVFTDTVDAGPSASGGSDTVTGLYNDTYYWRVRAIDDLGNQGTYSSTRGFVTDTHVAQVALVSPANNTSTPDTTPTLSWSAVGDSVGIDSYVVEVSGHPAFAYTNFSDTIDGALTSDTTGILADSTYYWRVRGIDHLGNTGANSDSFVLRIDTGVVVILVSPSAGHETNVGTIVFTWSGDAADTFTWQISRSSVFATISDSVVDTTSLSLLRTLPAQDSFYWRVIVRDASGNEDTAAGRIIVLDSTAAPVTLSYPADRHETTAIGILVGWTATADSVGLDSYAVEVSTNSAFTNMAFTDTLDAISSAAGGSDTLTGLYNDTYYWRVRAIDDLGNQGAFTASRGFVTDTLVNQVTLSFPADRHETTAINLVAGWSAVADSVGVDSYAVEVSTNTAFTNLVFTDTLDMLLTTDTITGLYNDTYYWRVRAIDNLGNVGPASTQRTFVLDTAVDRVTLAGPPKGTTSSNPNVALTWNELADSVGIDSYAVELSSSPVFAAFNFADTVAGSRTSDTTTSLVSSTYYWRVRAIDRLGNIGQSSDSFYFLIDTSLTVTLSAPPDGHETTAITVLFVWSGNLTDTYTWQLSRSAAFATLADSVTDTGAESLLRTMPGEDTFYWRVIGRDTTGSMDTQMRGLVVDTSVNQVGLASPSDGHETTSSRVVVSWTAVSDSVGIDSYAVEVSRTPAFTALAYADTLDGAVTSDTPVLADNDSYHVRVRAIDHLGNNGTYSAARGFVTDTRVSQVVLASPSDGHETTSSRVVVSWTAVSDSVGIDSYA
ncbi:SusE domain-containing protein, partial [bacterium]|nr:SusE domain-containing protein [bacterium]